MILFLLLVNKTFQRELLRPCVYRFQVRKINGIAKPYRERKKKVKGVVQPKIMIFFLWIAKLNTDPSSDFKNRYLFILTGIFLLVCHY